MKILWDVYEAALLIETYIAVRRGKVQRKDAVKDLSETLRNYGRSKGLEIDDIYRNENGISLRLQEIACLFNNGIGGIKSTSKLFISMVELFKNDWDGFNGILEKAKKLTSLGESKKQLFFNWLQNQVDLKIPAKQVLDTLETGSNYTVQQQNVEISFWNIDDIDVFDEIYLQLKESYLFKVLSKEVVSQFEQCAQYYRDFLNESNGLWQEVETFNAPEVDLKNRSEDADLRKNDGDFPATEIFAAEEIDGVENETSEPSESAFDIDDLNTFMSELKGESKPEKIEVPTVAIKTEEIAQTVEDIKKTNSRTIAEAVVMILEKAAEPMTSEEIYNKIVDENLYIFGAQDPKNVVAKQIMRACRESKLSVRKKIDLFGSVKDKDGKNRYFLLTRENELFPPVKSETKEEDAKPDYLRTEADEILYSKYAVIFKRIYTVMKTFGSVIVSDRDVQEKIGKIGRLSTVRYILDHAGWSEQVEGKYRYSAVPVEHILEEKSDTDQVFVNKITEKKEDVPTIFENNPVLDLNAIGDLSFTKPVKLKLFDFEENGFSGWSALYIRALDILRDRYPGIITNGIYLSHGRVPDVSNNPNIMRMPKSIGDDLYVETNQDSKGLVSRLAQAFRLCYVDLSTVQIQYMRLKDKKPLQHHDRKIENIQRHTANTGTGNLSVSSDSETGFLNWLIEQQHLPSAQSKSYVQAVRELSYFLKEYCGINENFFLINDPVKIERYEKLILCRKEFFTLMQQEKVRFNSALIYYVQFLKSPIEANNGFLIKEENSAYAIQQRSDNGKISAGTFSQDETNHSIRYNSTGEDFKQSNDFIDKQVDFNDLTQLAYSKPTYFLYFEEKYDGFKTWKMFYVKAIECLLEDYPDTIYGLMNRSIFGGSRYDFADELNVNHMLSPRKIRDGFYIETNFSAKDIVIRIRELLDQCLVDYENFEIHYCKTEKSPIRSQTDENPSIDIGALKQNRVQFIGWMRNKQVATGSIFGYLDAIEKCSNEAQNDHLVTDNLLLIKDAEKLSHIREALFAKSDFTTRFSAKLKRFNIAFDLLIEFRREEGNHSSKTITEKIPVDDKSFSQVPSFSDELSKQCSELLSKYFAEDGYQCGRAVFRGRLKNYYEKEYGIKINIPDENIDLVLMRVGMKIDDRIFPKTDNSQGQLILDIINDILAIFDEGYSVVYLESLMERYGIQLAERLQIYHSDALESLIAANAKGKFYIRNTRWIAKDRRADAAKDICRIVKDFYEPISLDVIHDKAWFIPKSNTKTILNAEKSIVNVAQETYFYAPNLPINSEEVQKIYAIIKREVEQHGFVTDMQLVQYISDELPDVKMNIEGFSVYGLRNCFGYIYRNYFSFKGPIISKKGYKVSTGDVYTELARTHETLELEEIKNLSAELNTVIYWDMIYNEMVRVSENNFVRKDLIRFNIDEIDHLLEDLCPDNYLPIREVNLFLAFPSIGYPWNSFILESYLYNFSRKFKLIHASFSQDNVSGAMVRKSCEINDYRSLIVDALSKNEKLTSVNDALNFIVKEGFQQRKRFEGLDSVIREAKLKKENIEK